MVWAKIVVILKCGVISKVCNSSPFYAVLRVTIGLVYMLAVNYDKAIHSALNNNRSDDLEMGV